MYTLYIYIHAYILYYLCFSSRKSEMQYRLHKSANARNNKSCNCSLCATLTFFPSLISVASLRISPRRSTYISRDAVALLLQLRYRGAHNEWLLLQFARFRAVIIPTIVLSIGTHLNEVGRPFTAAHPCSKNREEVQTSTRGICTVNSSRESGLRQRERKVANDIYDMPIPHERAENTIPHLSFLLHSWTNLFAPLHPSRPTSLLTPRLPFSFSLSRSRSTVSFASRSIFTIQETKWQVHGVWRLSHLQDPPKSLSHEHGHRVMDSRMTATTRFCRSR